MSSFVRGLWALAVGALFFALLPMSDAAPQGDGSVHIVFDGYTLEPDGLPKTNGMQNWELTAPGGTTFAGKQQGGGLEPVINGKSDQRFACGAKSVEWKENPEPDKPKVKDRCELVVAKDLSFDQMHTLQFDVRFPGNFEPLPDSYEYMEIAQFHQKGITLPDLPNGKRDGVSPPLSIQVCRVIKGDQPHLDRFDEDEGPCATGDDEGEEVPPRDTVRVYLKTHWGVDDSRPNSHNKKADYSREFVDLPVRQWVTLSTTVTFDPTRHRMGHVSLSVNGVQRITETGIRIGYLPPLSVDPIVIDAKIGLYRGGPWESIQDSMANGGSDGANRFARRVRFDEVHVTSE